MRYNTEFLIKIESLSFTLKKLFMRKVTYAIKLLLVITAFILIQISCKKNSKSEQFKLSETKTFSSALVVNWIDMQLKMLQVPLPAGTGSQACDRAQAYCGIALYESVVPGMQTYQSLYGQLTDFPSMPVVETGMDYHWAASANAALAEINRLLFSTTADVNKASINTLETNLNNTYAAEVDAATLQRSISFGKEVATRVFQWATKDGFANTNPPYVPPVGPGLWVPTATTPPVNAYAFQRRLMVPGSADGTTLTPLPPFSTDPGSAFYAMAKEVYDVSFVTSADQKAIAIYYRDVPGYSPGGGYVSLLSQALSISKPTLDVAAITYVKVGISQHEATIILNTDKYKFNVIRPITYIRAYIDPNWQPYIGTPNHPEFPSGHATTNGAVLTMMSNMFGENFPITLHTYDYLTLPSRTYNTFTALGLDMANSRLYGGLHYKETCEKSIAQGKKIAQNILLKIKFLK